MTRETKVGLVVASSFLGLVGVVLASKLKQDDDLHAEAPQPRAASAVSKTPAAGRPARADAADKDGKAARGNADKAAPALTPPSGGDGGVPLAAASEPGTAKKPEKPNPDDLPLAAGNPDKSPGLTVAVEGAAPSASPPLVAENKEPKKIEPDDKKEPVAAGLASRERERPEGNGAGPGHKKKDPPAADGDVNKTLAEQTDASQRKHHGPGEKEGLVENKDPAANAARPDAAANPDKKASDPVTPPATPVAAAPLTPPPGGEKTETPGTGNPAPRPAAVDVALVKPPAKEESNPLVPPAGGDPKAAGAPDNLANARPPSAVGVEPLAAAGREPNPLAPARVEPARVPSGMDPGANADIRPVVAPAAAIGTGAPAPLPPLGAEARASSRPIAVAGPSGGSPRVESFDLETYTARPADSFAAISKEQYQSDKYEKALLQFNRDFQSSTPELDQANPALRAGQVVYVPPAQVLEGRYPALIGTGPPAASASAPLVSAPVIAVPRPAEATTSRSESPGPTAAAAPATKIYRVQGKNETLYQIAQQALKNHDRWMEIYNLNRGVDPKYPVPAGTVLNLPADAQVEATGPAAGRG